MRSKKKIQSARDGGRIELGSLGDGGVVGSVFWFVWVTGTADLLLIWAEDLLIVEHSPAIWTTSPSRDTFCPSYTPLCHGLSDVIPGLIATQHHDASPAPMVCQGFDTYLCDKLVGVYKNVKQGIQENGGQCYLGSRDGVGLDGVVRQPQCDWAMSAYYLAYYASHQIMWVDIPRDMWAMGFPAAFQKHVGLTVDEFAESFSNFMNSGSPDDPPPEGFFTEKPLSELVDFWSLKTNPSGMAQ